MDILWFFTTISLNNSTHLVLLHYKIFDFFPILPFVYILNLKIILVLRLKIVTGIPDKVCFYFVFKGNGSDLDPQQHFNAPDLDTSILNANQTLSVSSRGSHKSVPASLPDTASKLWFLYKYEFESITRHMLTTYMRMSEKEYIGLCV